MTNERREWMERVAASTAICSDPTKECGGCVYDHLCGKDSEQAPDLLREAGGLIWELLGELDGMKLMGELDRRENGQLSGKTEQSDDRANGGGEGPAHGQDWEMDSEADGERTVKRIKLSQKDVKKMHRAIGDIEGIAAGVNDNQADVLFNVLNFLEKIMKGD